MLYVGSDSASAGGHASHQGRPLLVSVAPDQVDQSTGCETGSGAGPSAVLDPPKEVMDIGSTSTCL